VALDVMTQCEEIAPLLGAFQDGELLPPMMKEVARHVAKCKDCEDALDSYSAVGEMLRSTSPEPNLDGFVMAVQARTERLRPGLRVRFGRWVEAQRERFGGVPSIALAMSGAALLAFVVATPLARHILGTGDRTVQTAARDAHSLARDAASAPGALADAIGNGPGTIISRLETSNPDVAVWSEPSQDTTVIWLPDRQP